MALSLKYLWYRDAQNEAFDEIALKSIESLEITPENYKTAIDIVVSRIWKRIV